MKYNADLSYNEQMQQFLDSMRRCYHANSYNSHNGGGILSQIMDVRDGVWQSFERGGRPGQDEKVENKNISKRCVVRYDDEDRVARYDFDREQWICCVRGVVLQDIKYFMQIPELVED